MAELDGTKRARLPNSAFAYVDSKGRKRLPINDEAHVRNALARFNQVRFDDDAAREKARRRLLTAARKYGIVPIGFMDGQIRAQMTQAERLATENERLLGQVEAQASEVQTLPVGFVTFLLTDIEDSTSLIRRLGDEYAALLNDVRSLIRVAVSRSGGREVDARADEFFAVFETVEGAVEVALSVQRALRDRAWPNGVEVRLRIGIHSGRPTLTDTGYVGMAVHTAARVCSAAHGGQVLLSAAARDALAGSLPAGVTAKNLGPRRLRGIPEQMELFQLADGALAQSEAPRVLQASAPSAWSDDHGGNNRPEA
jgi:class 3 adenylate cyclase